MDLSSKNRSIIEFILLGFMILFSIYYTHIPIEFHALLFVTLVIIFNLTIIIERLPDVFLMQLLTGVFVGFIMVHRWIQNRLLLDTNTYIESLFSILFSVAGGVILWLLCSMIFVAILESTTNLNLDSITDDIDDPYNDRHAERILNQDE